MNPPPSPSPPPPPPPQAYLRFASAPADVIFEPGVYALVVMEDAEDRVVSLRMLDIFECEKHHPGMGSKFLRRYSPLLGDICLQWEREMPLFWQPISEGPQEQLQKFSFLFYVSV